MLVYQEEEIMKTVAKFACILIVLLAVYPLGTVRAEEQTYLYAQLLQQYVKDGKVDYLGLKKKEAQLDSYLDSLNTSDPARMARNERFAFYINAYNAYTLKLILKNFKNGRPPESIKDIGGFFTKPWSIKFVKIGGKTYTLDNIEHGILRPTFKDPRVHFAVNCASISCPPLLSTPYVGETLDQQLEANARAFINNRQENRLEGNVLSISSIFKWFKEDFHKDPLAFFEKYAQGDLKRKLAAARGNIRVRYLDYNWSLNGTR